jgi:ATP synthase protein I
MTTETMHHTRSTGVRVLLGAAVTALLTGLVVTLIGALTSGSAAAYGALAGTAIVVGVFALGSFVVNAVAGLMPAAALLVALLTYTLQVVLMAVVFWGLTDSGALDSTLDRGWLAGAVIAGTLAWLAAQVWWSTRLRLPAYDLAAHGLGGGER